MNWRPSPRIGVLVGGGILLLIVLVDGGLLWRTVRGQLNGITFVCALLVLLSLPLMAVIGYRIYDLLHLRYDLDRNRLVIVTAATRQIIPVRSIERVINARQGDLRVWIKSLVWPGCFIGHGDVKGIGLTLFFGVTPPHEQTIIVTPTLAYGISVPDKEAFREVFHACRQLGPSVEVRQESVQSSYAHWPIWSDRVAQGVLLGGIFLSAILFAILLFRYPRLPNVLPMHYDATGQVDRIAPRSEAFDLPIIGLITWAVNGILGALFYRRQRMISYLAWTGTLVVQVLFLLALWNIVT